jgi:hypothetical protein
MPVPPPVISARFPASLIVATSAVPDLVPTRDPMVSERMPGPARCQRRTA